MALYKAEFEAMSNRIKDLSPLHKLSCFLSGLKDEIRLLVRMLNPSTLNEAFGLAKIQEEYVFSCKKNSRFQQETSKGSILGLPKNNVVIESKSKIPIKRLTPTQMDERRKRGLCYNCDEKWGVGHKCKNAKLFLLEGIELACGVQYGVQITELEEEMESEVATKAVSQEEEVEITLYTLTRTPTPGTMRVRGKVHGSGLVILIDIGSTHNFVDASLVSGLQLRIDVSRVLGFCSNVTMCIQRVKFCIQFHVLALGGCDAVLGTQWLSTLGEI